MDDDNRVHQQSHTRQVMNQFQDPNSDLEQVETGLQTGRARESKIPPGSRDTGWGQAKMCIWGPSTYGTAPWPVQNRTWPGDMFDYNSAWGHV